jgi:hypothetical protein
MPTKREYLVSKGLAKNTRGRFNREAVAELERARASGMTFDDDENGGESGSSDEEPAPSPYIPPRVRDYPVVRKLDSVVGFSPEGYRVVSDLCFKCSLHVSRCYCTGITPSPAVSRWDKKSAPYGIDLSTSS